MMEEKMDISHRLHEIAEVFTDDAYKEDCTNNFLGDSSGAVLFLLYYAKQFDNETALSKAADLFAKVAHAYNSGYAYPPSLAKFLFLVLHVKSMELIEFGDYSEEETALLQSYLRKTAANFYKDKNFDILHGGLGNGLFLLKSGDVSGIKEMVEGVASLAEVDKNGLKWYALTNYEENRWTYNLGFAHGIPSIVAMLSKIQGKSVERERCAELIEGASITFSRKNSPKATTTPFSAITPMKAWRNPIPAAWLGVMATWALPWLYGEPQKHYAERTGKTRRKPSCAMPHSAAT